MHVDKQRSQHHLLKKAILICSSLNYFDILSKSIEHNYKGLFLDSSFFTIDLYVCPFSGLYHTIWVIVYL